MGKGGRGRSLRETGYFKEKGEGSGEGMRAGAPVVQLDPYIRNLVKRGGGMGKVFDLKGNLPSLRRKEGVVRSTSPSVQEIDEEIAY